MPEPADRTVLLDGVPFRLARGDGGRGIAWDEHHQAALPGEPRPEEGALSRAPASFVRTVGWLDFTGLGAAKKRAGGLVHYSEGPSGASPGRLLRGHEIRSVTPANGEGSVTDFFEHGSKLYAVVGPTARRITLTTNAETVADRTADGAGSGDGTGVYVSTLTFTQASPPWYDGTSTKVFLGTTDNADPIVSFNGTATWAQAGANIGAGYWALGTYGDGQRLWASSCETDTKGTFVANLPTGQNPAGAILGVSPWSSLFHLADRSADILALAALREHLVMALSDGTVFALPYQSGIPIPLTDFRGLVGDADAGRQMRVWGGVLFWPTPRGLFAYVEQGTGAAQFDAVGPEHWRGHESPIRGTCTAMSPADPAGLWAAFYNGSDSYVLRGRWPRPGEDTGGARFVWDTEGVGLISSAKVTALHVTHLGTNPVLCIGTNTPTVRFVTLPRAQRSPLEDTNCRSRTSAHSVFLADDDLGAPTTRSAFLRLSAKTRGFTSSEKADVLVRVDRGTFTQVGTFDSSPTDEITLGSGYEGSSLGVQLTFSGSDNTAFPQIDGVVLEAREAPEPAAWVDCVVYLATGQQTATGSSARTPRQQLDALYGLLAQARPFPIVGPDGRAHTGSLDPVAGVHPRLAEALADRGPAGLGYVVPLRLNLYDSLDAHAGFLWDVDSWSTSVSPSFWG